MSLTGPCFSWNKLLLLYVLHVWFEKINGQYLMPRWTEHEMTEIYEKGEMNCKEKAFVVRIHLRYCKFQVRIQKIFPGGGSNFEV